MFLLMLFACGSGDSDSASDGTVDLTVSLAVPPSGYQVITDSFEVGAFEEMEICTVIRAEPHEEEVLGWFDRIEILSSEGSHHMNVMIGQFSFLDAFTGDGSSAAALGLEEGQYPCAEIDYMESLFPVFPSQRAYQEVTLPDGVAAPLLVPALLVFSHHYINPTEDTLLVNAAINFHTVAPETVIDVASIVFDSINDLEIPAGSQVVASRTCAMERDVNVALVSTHNHQWGDCATLNHYDSESVEETPFFVNRTWETPPLLHFSPGEFTLSAGQGVHYACHFRNRSEETVINDGTAEGEMCVFASVIYPAVFSVEEVEDIVEKRDLIGLTEFMGDAMGPCDTHIETESPWPIDSSPISEAEDTCEGFAQTESNTLE